MNFKQKMFLISVVCGISTVWLVLQAMQKIGTVCLVPLVASGAGGLCWNYLKHEHKKYKKRRKQSKPKTTALQVVEARK